MEIRTVRDRSGLRDSEAIYWCRKVAETGDIEAVARVGAMLSWTDDATAEAEGRQWLDFAIAAGHIPAMYELAGALRRRRDGEAEVWYLRAAEAGHVAAMEYLAQIYLDSGRISEAETWYRRAIEAGNTGSAINLVILLAKNGRDAEIAEWMDWAHRHVAERDIMRYAHLLSFTGTDHLANQWLEHYAKQGNGEAMVDLATNYSRQDRAEEAEHWYRAAVEAGHPGASGRFAYWLDQQGRAAEAEQWRGPEDRSWMDGFQARSITDIVTIGVTILTTSAVVPFITAIAQEAGKNTYERVKKHFVGKKDDEVVEALDESNVIKIVVRDPEMPVEVEIRRDLPPVAADRLGQLVISEAPSRYVWNPITQSWQAEEP